MATKSAVEPGSLAWWEQVVSDIEARRKTIRMDALFEEHGITRRTYERWRSKILNPKNEEGAPLD